MADSGDESKYSPASPEDLHEAEKKIKEKAATDLRAARKEAASQLQRTNKQHVAFLAAAHAAAVADEASELAQAAEQAAEQAKEAADKAAEQAKAAADKAAAAAAQAAARGDCRARVCTRTRGSGWGRPDSPLSRHGDRHPAAATGGGLVPGALRLPNTRITRAAVVAAAGAP